MADVTLSYKGSDILELSDSGSATLKTGGKYCEDDIGLEYVKPSGGGSAEYFLPDFYVYELVDGSYVDRTQARMSYKPLRDSLKSSSASPSKNIKNVYGNDYRYSSSASALYYLQTCGVGANSNLLCDGLKVYIYSAIHVGFSSNANLNQESDGAPKNLIPTSFTASGTAPNYYSLCNGYTITQITITVANPTADDFICKSVYISVPAERASPQTSTTVTGAEHCI